jgi:hypothetical protein
MKPSVIVWDLETVPDLAGFAAANDLVGKSDAEVREAIGDKFPKHIYHSIVCIGALIAHSRRVSGRKISAKKFAHYRTVTVHIWRTLLLNSTMPSSLLNSAVKRSWKTYWSN